MSWSDQRPFRITYINRYFLLESREYDEYSMVYSSSSCIGRDPWQHLAAHKSFVLHVLQEDICKDIGQYISISAAWVIDNQRVRFGLVVREPECSVMIKLKYS